ncbi:L-glutamate gamma-semialdehyde dehydrogenase [Tuwongella immobilis]|uniref:L-glutamate gamma-semialdehyde dehydrogenase n=1 Tax=Tuwongella immobilis TaxID=692036 RepID=A0A6C2YRD8_9BACT|nr:L-glutamate gamma-semialdehyde dehydrogenase [Tuwongella immobilis]VIP03921.1 1-pyrroline-5-carboxylate dehydrogenase : 1-pyrroline-5 carboxylate dehydrogenase OS=Planctomyces maris DSM 8797 GN=PM8797T_17322 PE=3 SV=1: Pro_dh: Aldedh [Tuwongella immobilis]VTS05209.1 1-pyrroline-5-carboxylate dehydrogenase : 1-pyrroline-5 carboxylate dehydrogenase OS=Planctomyces maris DSM 8797 GN=PM8797T_17322 PE=3 SV=1: Pro_dh: Aldedh [Tuwongella immobilis]
MSGFDREARIQTIGRALFAGIDRSEPLLGTPAWFDDQLMGFTMSNPALKVQLFRFIDALPLLKNSESISQHLREYLGEQRELMPWIVRAGLPWIPSRGLAGRFLAWSARWNAERLARRFIAGTNVAEAVAAVAGMRQRSLAFTIDLLGEATITEPEADAVAQQYHELLDGLSTTVNSWPTIEAIDRDHDRAIPRVNVSVKLSALYSQFDPIDPVGTARVVNSRLRPILRQAKQLGAFVNFDMEQYSFKDVTLKIFRDLLMEPEFRDWPDVGIAMQAYLRDTEADLHALGQWAKSRGTPVWIRLVKGAYWDYETVIAAQNDWMVPVFTEKWQSDASFERCGRYLMENWRWLRPAFGSHNLRSIAAMMAAAEEFGVPENAYEFQMLYGMADRIASSLQSLRRRVRIYTPYGQLLPGMAYLVRRLLENTSNESFLRAGFHDHLPEEELLMNPQARAELRNGSESRNGHAAAATSAASHTPATVVAERPFTNEPPIDFSREANQQRMQAALDQVRGQLGRGYPLSIGGKPVETGAWIESVNPSHARQLVGQVAAAGPSHTLQAIETAKRAFDSWRDTDVEVRAEILRKAAAIIRQRRFELAAWITLESAKPWRESDGDVAEAIDFLEYYATGMERLAHSRHRNLPGEANETFYEPRGVAVVIAPWNFPLAILTGMVSAALVTGNTVIMKPAEQSPVIAALLQRILEEAGVPAGVVNYLPGVGEVIGPILVQHPDVALIAFTGSLGVGLAINKLAGETPQGQLHIKKVIAELGGKNAMIVDGDADLDEAVKGVVDSAFGFAGQKCSAGSRAIVLEPIYDRFVERLVEATKALTVAPADEPGCGVPPVIDAEARNRILKMIEVGKSEAKLAFGGDVGELANEGFYVAPHVFVDVPPNASLAQDEIFGPVLAVTKAANLDEALAIANGTRFALTGGIFSRSPQNIATVKRKFRVGNLYVNRKITGALVDRQPFGGFRLSGIGSKAGGPDYLLQFLLPRTITENTLRRGFAPEVMTD